MRNYNIVFTGQENEKFNLLETQRIKESCMSIYSYLLKLNMEQNEKCNESGMNNLKESTKLNISMRDFLKRYKRHHDSMSIRTLKKRIDLLIDLRLIVVETIKNSFVYSFFRYDVNKKVNNLDEVESTENTNCNDDSIKPKYLNTNFINDYDSNSVNTIHNKNSFDKEKYIAELEKCSWEFACDIMTDAFFKLKITNTFVKCSVLEKIIKYHDKITRKHAEAYIVTTIKNECKNSENIYKQRVLGNNYSNFNNFPQRRYDGSDGEFTLKDFENKALGYV